MLRVWTAAAAAVMIVSPACAQAVRSEVVASNGVTVTVYADEFANRYEYSAPSIDVQDGFALVSKVDRGDTKGPIYLGGSFLYSGEWRYYDSALFRGGDAAEFTSTGREVGRCSSSRYSRPSCSLREGFRIDFTAEDVANRAQDGQLGVQIRAGRSAQAVLVSIPVSYIEAVREVSSRPR